MRRIKMISNKKALEMIDVISNMFPDAECELVHENPFELTIAVLLSAQTTDVSVNKLTKHLFKKYKTPRRRPSSRGAGPHLIYIINI